jgi:hypothetical protein
LLVVDCWRALSFMREEVLSLSPRLFLVAAEVEVRVSTGFDGILGEL